MVEPSFRRLFTSMFESRNKTTMDRNAGRPDPAVHVLPAAAGPQVTSPEGVSGLCSDEVVTEQTSLCLPPVVFWGTVVV